MSSFFLLLVTMVSLLCTGCNPKRTIVTQVSEKEANVILVLLESRGIAATKEELRGSTMESDLSFPLYAIAVGEKEAIQAIAILNQNGFPREKGPTLLTLFAKQGLMTSGKEETIRYQAGLAQELTNTLLMIDGVIEANVQLSFPPDTQETGVEGGVAIRPTAAVYVKHQGIIDDPNLHLESKIKRLVSGSVVGLDINDVTVVSDRSRFTDIALASEESSGGKSPEYVRIWGIVLSKESTFAFRLLFFFLTSLVLLLLFLVGWITWKFYPHLKTQGGLKALFDPIPFLHLLRKKREEVPKQESPREENE